MMRKEEYINQLKQGLQQYPYAFQQEILEAFEEHFNEAFANNLTEQEIIDSLGTVEEVLQNVQEIEVAAVPAPITNYTSVRIHIPLGNCDVTVYTADTTNYTYKPSIFGNSKNYIVDKVENNECIIEPAYIDQAMNGKLFVYVHPNTDITIETKTSDVKIKNCTLHNATIKTTSGDVKFEYSTIQNIQVETTTGDIDTKRCTLQQCVANALSGDITFKSNSDTVDLRTVSGDIDADFMEVNKARLIATSGDIDVMVNDVEYTLQVETVSGDIDISTDSHKYCGSGSCTFGSGPSVLSISTMSGDVFIE